MKKPKYFLPVMILLLSLGGLALSACVASRESGSPSITGTVDEADQGTATGGLNNEGREGQGGESETNNGEDLDPTSAPTDTNQDVAVENTGEANQCVECHTDKQALVDTAAPVVEVEEESEGEG